MSMTIDQRVVEMKFDNANFDKNVSSSISALDKLKAALKFDGAAKGFENLNDSVRSVNVSVLSEGVEKVQASFSALEVFSITVLQKISSKLIDAAGSAAQFVKSMSVDQISEGMGKLEEKTKALATMVSQGYDIDTVEDAMSKLMWYSDETSYSFSSMTSGLAQFTSQGIELEDAVNAMMGISNWAALTGKNATEASAALIQITQAMGVGALRGDDFKSLRQRGFITEEFKQKAIEAAEEMKTLKRINEDTWEAASGKQYSFEELFGDAMAKERWLDSDVMMQTFGKYGAAMEDIYKYTQENENATATDAIDALGDSLDKFGVKAFLAGQEYRTFEDVIAATKDAVSSGWMASLEYIFGSFEEAKALYKDLGGAFWDFFNGGAEARNEMLASWKELGGRDDLIEGFWNIWYTGIDILDAVKEGFQEVFPALTAERLVEITKNFKTFAENLVPSKERLEQISSAVAWVTRIFKNVYGALKNVIGTFKDFGTAVKDGIVNSGLGRFVTIVIEDFSEKLEKITGIFRKTVFNSEEFGGTFDAMTSIFTNLGNVIGNVYNWIFEIGKRIKFAFKTIFPKSTGSIIEDLIYKFETFTAKLANATSYFNLFKAGFGKYSFFSKLTKIFQGVFSAIDVVKMAFSSLWKIAQPILKDLFSIAKKVGSILISVFVKVGEWITRFRNWAKTTGFFDTVAEKVTGAYAAIKEFVANAKTKITEFFRFIKEKLHIPGLSEIKDKVKAFIDILKGNVDTPGLDRVKDVVEKLRGHVKKADDNTRGLRDTLVNFFKDVGERFKNSKLLEFLKAFWEFSKRIASEVAGKLKTGISAISDKLSNGGLLDTAIEALKGLSLGGLVLVIKKFFDKLSNPLESVGDIFGGIKDVLDSVRGCFEAWQTKLKADALLKIAAAVGVLAVSMVILASVPADKILVTFGGVTGLLGELLGSMALLNKMDAKNGKGMKNIASAMMSMSIALLIVSFAVAKISKIDKDKITSSIVAVAALAAVMVLAANNLNAKEANQMKKTATAMVIFSAAMLIMASVAKKFSTMSWEELAKGLAGVAGLLLAVDLFLNTAKFDKKAAKTGVGVLLVAVAIGMLAKTAKIFSEMSWEEIGKGLAAVGGLLLELAVFLNMASGLKKLMSAGISLVLVAAAIKILSSSMTIFSKMSWEEIGKGLAAVGVLLIELMIALNTMPKNMIGIGLGLLLVATSMSILGNVMTKLGAMTPEELIKSLVGMGVALAELALGLNAMKGTLGASAALLVAAIALTSLAITLKLLATLSWEDLLKGLAAIGGVLLIMGIAGELLGGSIGAILGLSAGLLVLGVAMAAVGAGLLLLSTGITAFIFAMTMAGENAELVAAGIFVVVESLVLGIIALLPAIVMAVVDAIVQIVVALAQAAPTLGASILVICGTILATLYPLIETIVLMVIDLLDTVLRAIADHTPSIVQSVMDILLAILQGIADNIQAVVETGIDIANNILYGVAEKLPDIIQAGFDLLLAFIDGITQGIRDNRESLMQKFNELAAEIIETLIYVIVHSFDFFKILGDNLVNDGFIQGIKDTWEDIKKVGGDLLKGLWNGITGAFNWLKEKVTGVIDSIKSWFTGKKGFDTHSPSKVFENIGENCMEGLGLGFFEGGEDVLEGVGANTDSILGKYTSLRDELPGIFDEDFVDVEPVISPELDLTNIENGFADYTSMLDGVNGLSLTPSFDTASLASMGFDTSSLGNYATSSDYASSAKSGYYNSAGNYVSSGIGSSSNYNTGRVGNGDTFNNTFNNTFNITGDDPEVIADAVARIIQERIDRREAVWA